jgi:hypothetical protein
MFIIAFLGLIITLAINREKLQRSKLKVEIINDAFKVNFRTDQILDFQINLRIQAINGKICLRKIVLICKKGLFDWQDLEVFEKAVNIGGDLTKYNEDEFDQFMSCVFLECGCSKIIEYESRFREFIQLRDLILEKDIPRSITLLGRICDWQKKYRFFLQFDYDLNGSRRKLSKKLDFEKYLQKG